MYYGYKPNAAQQRVMANNEVLRAKREAAEDTGGLAQVHAKQASVVERVGEYVETHAAQERSACKRIAQQLADYIAEQPVDLTVEHPAASRFMARRDTVPMTNRVNALVGLARRAGLDADSIKRIEAADVAEIQTYEYATWIAVRTLAPGDDVRRVIEIRRARPADVPPAAWGVR